MKYSSHSIFLLIPLLLVQSDDSSSRYFYQKLLTTTNRPTFLSTFSPVRTSKSQTTTSIISMYTLYHSNKRSIYETRERTSIDSDYTQKMLAIYREMKLREPKECYWYYKGIKVSCSAPRYRSKAEIERGNTVLLFIVVVFVIAIVIVALCGTYCACVICPDKNSPNVVRSNNPAIYNGYNIPASTESNGRPVYSEPQWQFIDNLRERHFQTQNFIRDIPLTHSISSIEQQLSENGNSNLRRTTVEQHISNLPPAYGDIVRQNSVTITMEQQSLIPPSYDEFIRKSNERQ